MFLHLYILLWKRLLFWTTKCWIY